jgi:hypothetical protein
MRGREWRKKVSRKVRGKRVEVVVMTMESGGGKAALKGARTSGQSRCGPGSQRERKERAILTVSPRPAYLGNWLLLSL